MVPPHDMPSAKKLMVDRTARCWQFCGNRASKRTSSGMRMVCEVAPERIARDGASTNVETSARARIAALRSDFSNVAVSSA